MKKRIARALNLQGEPRKNRRIAFAVYEVSYLSILICDLAGIAILSQSTSLSSWGIFSIFLIIHGLLGLTVFGYIFGFLIKRNERRVR